jgi:hypothetical protein
MQQAIKDRYSKMKYKINYNSATFNFRTKKYECGEIMTIVIPLAEL